MERQSMVHRVEVKRDGETYQADYFVEGGIIHASVDGQMVLRPLTSEPPSDSVRALLNGHLGRRMRKLSAASSWTALAQRGGRGG